jgi:hypothetical protein
VNNEAQRAASRAAKRRRKTPCPNCGELRAYDNPDGLCIACQNAERHEVARAHMVEEIQRWADLFDGPPTAAEWNLTMARQVFSVPRLAETERRHAVGGPFPAASTAQALYGTWNAAITAAGFVPRRTGGE